ncbi:hypothetical protein CPB85DRAFT_976618 [Mucidula mucida]|nr:hypothetical protein CPB85DRAFT_976618 [Mucidula mucida]
MPAHPSAYTPVAITARKRHYWKPYLHRRNRKAHSVPHVAYDFTQAPTRVFASRPDVNVDALENELRRMSLKPADAEDALNARFVIIEARLAEERRKFEDEKRQFEAERRQLESRVRVAEHNATESTRRSDDLEMEVEALDRALTEALQLIAQRVDLQEARIARRDQIIAEQDGHIVEQDRHIADQEHRITSLFDEGRALIQQKDQEIAALKASMQAPSAVHAPYPTKPQQSPSHFSSQYVRSSQDEQYDPSRPQFIPYQSHPAPAYNQQPLFSQQASHHGNVYHQPQSYHGYAQPAYVSPPGFVQDVSMD